MGIDAAIDGSAADSQVQRQAEWRPNDADILLEFYRYAAEHWIHLRTTNPIESTPCHRAVADRGPQAPAPAPPECHGLQAVDAA